ncbi:MAG TPA: hypothetical protein VMT55_03370, partial [Candidatus Sulfotelmatobacter sp.]|nr:hypothetical protein [Candidatus Sulfotelmatobacter sp.]
MKTQISKKEWAPTSGIIPLILGVVPEGKLDKKATSKLDLFEKCLGRDLDKEDSIEQAVTKIVKLALAAEFGPSLVKAAGASRMIITITRAIMSDPKLKK